jgi:predicted RNase H-like HicB family nuclease
MAHHFTLEYWIDDGWYVGRVKEIPGVFSQGETLADLQENVKDAYQLMVQESAPVYAPSDQIKELEFDL